VIAFIVNNFYENLSILTGFPFGHYHYTEALGPKLFLVPLLTRHQTHVPLNARQKIRDKVGPSYSCAQMDANGLADFPRHSLALGHGNGGNVLLSRSGKFSIRKHCRNRQSDRGAFQPG
jgi:Carotenoid biosynthesis protein